MFRCNAGGAQNWTKRKRLSRKKSDAGRQCPQFLRCSEWPQWVYHLSSNGCICATATSNLCKLVLQSMQAWGAKKSRLACGYSSALHHIWPFYSLHRKKKSSFCYILKHEYIRIWCIFKVSPKLECPCFRIESAHFIWYSNEASYSHYNFPDEKCC